MTTALTQAEINQRVLSSDQPTDKLGARTVRGGAIAVGAQIFRAVLQLVGVAMLARLLTPEQFGLVAMGSTVMALVSVLTELNITTATIQREKLTQDDASGAFWLNLAMAAMALVLALIAIPATTLLFHDARVHMIVLGLAATVPISALGAEHQALLSRNMRWLDVHLIALAGFVLGLIVAILAAWLFHAGYWALIIQAWVTAGATSALSWLRCPWRPSFVKDWRAATSTLHFGLNLSGAMFMSYISRQLDNVLIGWRWGSVQLGFYSRAYTLLQTPLSFLTGPLGSAMVPAMSQLHSEPQKWRNAYIDALSVITMIGTWMACLLYGGSSTIIDVVLGPGWDETKTIFSFLVISMLVATPMRTTGWIYMSSGRTDRMLAWAFVGTPMYVIAFIVGLPYGAAGVALCYSISQLLAFLPCMWMAVRGTSISMRDVLEAVAVPTIGAIVVGLTLKMATDQLPLIGDLIAMTLAGLLYGGLLVLAVWTMPIYARLRARALDLLSKTPWLRAQKSAV